MRITMVMIPLIWFSIEYNDYIVPIGTVVAIGVISIIAIIQDIKEIMK